jgi:hypothetical protein
MTHYALWMHRHTHTCDAECEDVLVTGRLEAQRRLFNMFGS